MKDDLHTAAFRKHIHRATCVSKVNCYE